MEFGELWKFVLQTAFFRRSKWLPRFQMTRRQMLQRNLKTHCRLLTVWSEIRKINTYRTLLTVWSQIYIIFSNLGKPVYLSVHTEMIIFIWVLKVTYTVHTSQQQELARHMFSVYSIFYLRLYPIVKTFRLPFIHTFMDVILQYFEGKRKHFRISNECSFWKALT